LSCFAQRPPDINASSTRLRKRTANNIPCRLAGFPPDHHCHPPAHQRHSVMDFDHAGCDEQVLYLRGPADDRLLIRCEGSWPPPGAHHARLCVKGNTAVTISAAIFVTPQWLTPKCSSSVIVTASVITYVPFGSGPNPMAPPGICQGFVS